MNWPAVIVSTEAAFLVLYVTAAWKALREFEATMRHRTEIEKPVPFFFTRRPQSIEEAIQMLQEQQESDGED